MNPLETEMAKANKALKEQLASAEAYLAVMRARLEGMPIVGLAEFWDSINDEVSYMEWMRSQKEDPPWKWWWDRVSKLRDILEGYRGLCEVDE